MCASMWVWLDSHVTYNYTVPPQSKSLSYAYGLHLATLGTKYCNEVMLKCVIYVVMAMCMSPCTEEGTTMNESRGLHLVVFIA